jgi:perosamine synthetase
VIDLAKIPMARPVVTDEMVKAVTTALREERMTMGESVFKFEEEFARFVGTDHAVSIASGTAALQLALIAARVKDREVITSPLSFIATANAAVQAGATPKFADVRKRDYDLDPKKVIGALTAKSAAVMPVHLYGYPADMDALSEIAGPRRMVVIEDAAQAHGATYKGRKIGSIGDMACFSFYPTKNMTVAGDGGMVTTNSALLAKEVAKLRDCGRVSRYVHDVIGFTYRLNTMNAAFGRVQLKHLEEWNERRRAIARLYAKQLDGLGNVILPPLGNKDIVPVFHLFVLRAHRRDELVKFLGEKGIECAVHYPVPIHLQPVYREMYGYREGAFPISEALCEELISIPMFPGLKDAEVKTVSAAIHEFYGGR